MIRLEWTARLTQGTFTLEVADAASVEVLGLFGPSGSGKTTILEVMAGLRRPDAGEVRVGERILFSAASRIDVPVHERRIGYVPQDVALFPHMNVRKNLVYGLRNGARRIDAGAEAPAYTEAPACTEAACYRADPAHTDAPVDRESAYMQVAEMLEIGPLLDRRVTDLSGGERQRVAIGRALMSAPALLLLDEPLTAVDRGRKDRILPYLLRIRRQLHVPLVYVTHDVAELREIADRVIRLEDGRIVGAGPPREVLG
jgi:molybdate transport system ATP-binding protein